MQSTPPSKLQFSHQLATTGSRANQFRLDTSGPQSVCRHRECPLYKAPPCFSRHLEELLSNHTCCGTRYPDWRQFTCYFNINIPVREQGVVRYWVHGHQNKDQHTIQCVLEFAEEKGHSPLVYEFEKLIEGKLYTCLLYTSPSPRDATLSRMPSSA